MSEKAHTPRTVVRELPVRWTQADIREGWPERFQKALNRTGAAQATVVREMVIRYTEIVEAMPQTVVEQASADVAKKPAVARKAGKSTSA